MEPNDRELSWDGCVNVRDLGGLGQIRPGAVVRMEQPTRLSAAGWASAWAYGVRTFVDLRNVDEGEPDRTPRTAGITTMHVPQDPVGTPFYEHWSEIDSLSSPLYYPAMLAEYPERVVAGVRGDCQRRPRMRGVPLRRRQGPDRAAGPGAAHAGRGSDRTRSSPIIC